MAQLTPELVAQFEAFYPDKISFLLKCNPSTELWDYIESENNISNKYWSLMQSNLEFVEIELRKKGIHKLIENGRPAFALENLGYPLNDYSSIYLIELLKKIGISDGPFDGPLDSYTIRSIFEVIQVDATLPYIEIGKLEFQYSPYLTKILGNSAIPNLSKILYSNPEELIEVYQYYQDAKNENEYIFFKDIIDNITEYPKDEDGSVSQEMITQWVNITRNLALKNGLLDKIDYIIGGVLGRVPKKKIIPSKFICELIEHLDSPQIIDGIKNEKRGGKGCSSNKIDDYKLDYQELIQTAESVRDRFPKTSELLYDWAESIDVTILGNRNYNDEDYQENQWLN